MVERQNGTNRSEKAGGVVATLVRGTSVEVVLPESPVQQRKAHLIMEGNQPTQQAPELHPKLTLDRAGRSFVLTIFGATGDLTERKLIPALHALCEKGHIDQFHIIAYSRRSLDRDEYRRGITIALREEADSDTTRIDEFASHIETCTGGDDGLAQLVALLDRIDSNGSMQRIFYLATPPAGYEPLVEALGDAGLARLPGITDGPTTVVSATAAGGSAANGPGQPRIIVEKPFGRDRETAAQLNRTLLDAFHESQVYRIDHYLGKETVQNLLMLRFGNGLLEPVWNRTYIHSVQITVAERIGIEGRGDYYDRSGAMRDIVQNHLLQLLCIVAMEPPNLLEANAIRDEKVKVLRSIAPISGADVRDRTIRARYAEGALDGKRVPGYLDEDGVAVGSTTETYAALALELDSWRWAGVPFFVRTGKRMPKRLSEIAIRFHQPPHHLLGGKVGPPNSLIVRIQPDEGASLMINLKEPGFTFDAWPVAMNFSYGSEFADELPDAYERLLLDAIIGDSTLYTRRDEIELAWELVDGIVAGWQETGTPLHIYQAGSSGPDAAHALIGDYGPWRDL